MRIITIASQKGGAGKTTLALHIAVEAERKNKATAIIDIDPQSSVTQWGDSRNKKSPLIVSAQPVRLEHVLGELEQAGADLVIIDTAPHSEHASLSAIRKADMVMIPCRPAILDLRAIGTTIDLIHLSKCPKSAVMLNAAPARGTLVEEAFSALRGLDINVCPKYLTQRNAFMNSLTVGLVAQEYEPNGKAAKEAEEVFKWVCKYANI